MKLLSIFAISAGASSFNEAFNEAYGDVSTMRSEGTSWDDALTHLKRRYKDLELKKYDTSDRFLRKSTNKLWRLMKNKKIRRERRGCWVSWTRTESDLSLDADEKCNYANTLIADIQAGVIFFLGEDPREAYIGNKEIPEQCTAIYSKFKNHTKKLLSWLNANYEAPDCLL